MRILTIGPSLSPHLFRPVQSLLQRGHQVCLMGYHSNDPLKDKNFPGYIWVEDPGGGSMPVSDDRLQNTHQVLSSVISKFRPHVIHVHWISSNSSAWIPPPLGGGGNAASLLFPNFLDIISYMKRTISLRILVTPEQKQVLADLQTMFAQACNAVVPYASQNKCSNRVALHHQCYYKLRDAFPKLGSQMVCNAIHKVASSYKTLISNRPKLKKEDWPEIVYRANASVHYDKRTYSLKGDAVSLFTLSSRIKVQLKIGKYQQKYLNIGTPKEAELIRRKNDWYFNLVLDIPDTEPVKSGSVMGVDLGENNLASTSTGKIFGGGKLCYERDKYLHLRKRLQSNGSKSAKQLLKKVSGCESRHVRHINHEVSKAIVEEAIANNCNVIAMENLVNIRKRIEAGKRVRSRLHRWAWAQLQEFVEYKAQAAGIKVVYVNPAYTSKTCSVCGNIGNRKKHQFSCPFCGRLAHADLNAGLNIASLGRTAVLSTGKVNCPNVAVVSNH